MSERGPPLPRRPPALRVLTPWWTDEGGAADVFAAHVGADRRRRAQHRRARDDAAHVLSTVAPEMMKLTTGRLADPQEVADAVVFLASPHWASTVGTELIVDSEMFKAYGAPEPTKRSRWM